MYDPNFGTGSCSQFRFGSHGRWSIMLRGVHIFITIVLALPCLSEVPVRVRFKLVDIARRNTQPFDNNCLQSLDSHELYDSILKGKIEHKGFFFTWKTMLTYRLH